MSKQKVQSRGICLTCAENVQKRISNPLMRKDLGTGLRQWSEHNIPGPDQHLPPKLPGSHQRDKYGTAHVKKSPVPLS